MSELEDLSLIEPALIANNAMSLGLGNRLRFTLSCQALAESEGRNFYYHWPVGAEFGAKFTDLWHYSEKELELPGPKPFINQWSTCMDDIAIHKDDRIISLIGSQVVKGFGNEERWESKLRKLKPVQSISDAANNVLSNINGNFIGVQVRASPKSHAKTLELSPVSWFVRRMLEIQDHDGKMTKFFLSCDDSEAQKYIISMVPHVYSISKSSSYNSKESLRESVVDLMILSKSKYLIGPCMSSFVYLAWMMSEENQKLETSQAVKVKKS